MSVRTRLLWAAGVVAILAVSFAVADPALLAFALDPELLAVLVLSSVALLRASPAFVAARGLCVALARWLRP